MQDQVISKITNKYTDSELLQICKVLNKEYNIYDIDDVRWKKIEYALYKTEQQEIASIKNEISSNEFINDLLIQHYICERVVKYHFICMLKDLSENIVAFEMAVGDSRVDICRINGYSYAYEIKTEYDNFERIESQMSDYIKAFEKVYVIVPKAKVNTVIDHIPDSCGIISYRCDNNHRLIFSYVRKSKKNNCDIEFCLKNLSSADMSKMLTILGEKNYNTKEDKLSFLLKYSGNKSMRDAYRTMLKEKYSSKWSFLKNNFDNILPIDIQNFFATEIDPSIIY